MRHADGYEKYDHKEHDKAETVQDHCELTPLGARRHAITHHLLAVIYAATVDGIVFIVIDQFQAAHAHGLIGSWCWEVVFIDAEELF